MAAEEFLSTLFHVERDGNGNRIDTYKDFYGTEWHVGNNMSERSEARNSLSEKGAPAIVSLYLVGLLNLFNRHLKAGKINDNQKTTLFFETESSKGVLIPDIGAKSATLYYKGSRNDAVGSMHLLYSLANLQNFSKTKAEMKKLCILAKKKSNADSCTTVMQLLIDSYYYEAKHFEGLKEIRVQEDDSVVEQYLARMRAVESEDVFNTKEDSDIAAFYQSFTVAGSSTSSDEKNEEENEIFKEAKEGKYLTLIGEFNDQGNIPDLDILETYVPGKEFYEYVRRLRGYLERYDPTKPVRRPLNLAFVGAPGTGKTHLTDILGATFGMPVYHMACGKHTEEQNFTWAPTIGDFGITQEATMTWNAFKNGGIIVLEEANLVDPGVLLGVFSKALESPGEIGDTMSQRTRRHPLCIVIMTMNPGATGTKSANEAFMNRFNFWTTFENPTKEDEVKRVNAMLGTKGEDQKIGVMYDIYRDIVIKTLDLGGTEAAVNVISTRSLANCAEDELIYGASRKEAVMSTLITPVETYISQNYDEDTAERFRTEVKTVILNGINEKNGSYRAIKKKVE